jgi:RNA-directed DNA polymerase
MDQVVSSDNITKALYRVELNKGAPGVDGMTVGNLQIFLNKNWAKIREEILNGTYQPQPIRRVEIPKPNGGTRLLGIPTVLDRMIQQAILQILTPVFDPTFSNSSYGFRPKRSAHQAVKQAQKYVNEGYKFVVDIDIEKFFDRVNHDILMARISRKIQDKRVLKLIRKYLQAGVMINGCCMTNEEGTPQVRRRKRNKTVMFELSA